LIGYQPILLYILVVEKGASLKSCILAREKQE